MDNSTRPHYRQLPQIAAYCSLTVFLISCGGGGSDNASNPGSNSSSIATAPTGASINAQNRVDFACDMDRSAATRPETSRYVTAFDPPNFPAGTAYAEQTWLVTGIGQERPEQHSLKTIVLLPPSSSPKNGVVMFIHGTSNDFLTPSKYSLADIRDYDDRWLQRGYAVVYVARRGYFGSSGVALASDKNFTSDDEASQRIDVGSFNASYLRWQSASMTAALQYMTNLPQFAGRMHSIVLFGASLGADTALFTAAESSVFQAASRRAVIRFTGLNSQTYKTFVDEVIGERAATSSVASRVNGPSLWFAGQADETSYLGQLACNFNLYTARSRQADKFYSVPGMAHAQQLDISSTTFASSINTYMRAQGFAGF